MMVDVFCGVLSGGPFAHHIRKWQADASVANLVSISGVFGVNGQLLKLAHHQGQTFVAINPDAFATGFEERMSTFSQEMRALNPVRTVVMKVLVYDTWGWGWVLCLG